MNKGTRSLYMGLMLGLTVLSFGQAQDLIALFKKLVKTQIYTKLAHETCAGHISRTTCLIVLVSFVSHSPTCTAGPGGLN